MRMVFVEHRRLFPFFLFNKNLLILLFVLRVCSRVLFHVGSFGLIFTWIDKILVIAIGQRLKKGIGKFHGWELAIIFSSIDWLDWTCRSLGMPQLTQFSPLSSKCSSVFIDFSECHYGEGVDAEWIIRKPSFMIECCILILGNSCNFYLLFSIAEVDYKLNDKESNDSFSIIIWHETPRQAPLTTTFSPELS